MVKLFRIRSALSRMFKEFIIRLKKSYKRFDMGCQADIIEPPKVEETQNEKLLDLYTNIKGGGILTGVKTFPRLKTEIGDNDKMIKKLLCKFNKNKNRNNDNIVISETCTVRLNVSEYDDDMDECKKIFGSVPKKSVLPSSPRYNRAIKLCKKTVSNTKWEFITKISKSRTKEEKIYKKKINLKLMLLLIFGYSSKASKHFLLNLLIEKFYLPFYHNLPISLVSIEDEVSENDINRIEIMRSKFTTTVGKSSYFIFNDENSVL